MWWPGRAARAARTEQRRADDATALAAVVTAHRAVPGAGARTVAAYASTPSEPGTAVLRAMLAARGATVLLPLVVGAGPLAWVVDEIGAAGLHGAPDGVGGQPGAGGVGVGGSGRGGSSTEAGLPPGLDLLAGVGVVLLPALAVTTDGHRLGQGGGHYDRTLAALAALPRDAPRPLLVALVHDGEILPPGSWPVEDHDVRVDAAATPSGWTDLVRG